MSEKKVLQEVKAQKVPSRFGNPAAPKREVKEKQKAQTTVPAQNKKQVTKGQNNKAGNGTVVSQQGTQQAAQNPQTVVEQIPFGMWVKCYLMTLIPIYNIFWLYKKAFGLEEGSTISNWAKVKLFFVVISYVLLWLLSKANLG